MSEEIIINNIIYSEPNVSFENNDGTFIKKSLINYNGLDNITFITPKLEVKSINDKNIEVLLPQIKSNKEFYDFFSQLEKDSINKCAENSLSWFKKQLSHQDINKLFKSHLQKPNFGEPYVLKLVLIKQPTFKEGDTINFTIKIDGILFAKHSFTLSLIVVDFEGSEKVGQEVSQEVSQEIKEPVVQEFSQQENQTPVVKESVISQIVSGIKEVIHGSSESNTRFVKGEKIEINYFGTWYPCTITNVINNDKYEVVYEDGTVQEVGHEYLKKIEDIIEKLDNQIVQEKIEEKVQENTGPSVVIHDSEEKDIQEEISSQKKNTTTILPVHPYDLKDEKTKEEIFIENIEKRIKEAVLENDYDLVLKLHAVLKDLKNK